MGDLDIDGAIIVKRALKTGWEDVGLI